MPAFHEALKAARLRAGLTQYELADKSGLHRTAVSHFETGLRELNIANLRTLSRTLCVSADELLGLQNALDHLTEEERVVLARYNALQPEAQRVVTTLLGALQ